MVKQRECRHHDALLKRGVIRHAKRTAKFERHPECPRWICFFGMYTDQADLRCCQPFFLKDNAKPANGARAFRSYRNQKDGIDAVLFHRTRHRARGLFEIARVRGARYREMVIRH